MYLMVVQVGAAHVKVSPEELAIIDDKAHAVKDKVLEAGLSPVNAQSPAMPLKG